MKYPSPEERKKLRARGRRLKTRYEKGAAKKVLDILADQAWLFRYNRNAKAAIESCAYRVRRAFKVKP